VGGLAAAERAAGPRSVGAAVQALRLSPGPLRILCVGAHADDIEIGCGGTVLRLLGERPGSLCQWIVLSGAGTEREREAQGSAEGFLTAAAERRVQVHGFRDGHFPLALSGIKETLEAARKDFAPDIVFAHQREDRHQDHRTVSDAAWQTFRDHLVLEYEVPKWDGDLGQPNLYVPLAGATMGRKVELLLAGFPSQRAKHWFGDDVFLGLSRLRGVECAAPEGHAEAFFARKVSLSVG
jgi:LmbE family N-acetylglucosaminyl deacetylase